MLTTTLKGSYKISLSLLAVAVVGIVGWLGMAAPEPVYDGKKISAWFGEIRVPINSLDAATKDPAVLAIKSMGKDAIPFLTRKLHDLNSPFHHRMAYWMRRISASKNDSEKETYDRTMACLFAFGAEAEEAVPELIELARRGRWEESGWNIYMLTHIHSRLDLTIPFLIEMAGSTNTRWRYDSIENLGTFGWDARQAIPMLIRQWPIETNPQIREVIAGALLSIDDYSSGFHDRPDLAFPFLMKFAEGTNSSLRHDALDGLTHHHSAARRSVPLLVSHWQAAATDPGLRGDIVFFFHALSDEDTKPAVPFLISQWQTETNALLRKVLAESIKDGDPEAAEKAGIK